MTHLNNIDYIVAGQFILHKQIWIPKLFIFVNVDSSKQYSVQPTKDSLNEFSLDDITLNTTLPYNPWHFRDDKDTFNIPIKEFDSFLINELYNKQWLPNANIGTLDMSMYYYLLPLFPVNTVHYLGPIRKESETLCVNPNIEKEAHQAAHNLFYIKQKEVWV